MALDPAWIGVIGTGIGAAASGLPSVVSSVVQSFSARGQRNHDAEQARITRQANDAAATAAREREASDRQATEAAGLQQQRRQKIAGWRAQLSAAVDAETDWRINDYGEVLRPSLIGQPWFEELRGYLSEPFSFATNVYAEPEMIGHLSRLIVHLERQWGLADWLPSQLPHNTSETPTG